MYEFHCPKLASKPQVKPYNPDEYLDRTNTYLDDIIVTDDTRNNSLTYGVTSDSNVNLKNGEGSKWFSACDFIVERVGD